jgi:hypothetical protein
MYVQNFRDFSPVVEEMYALQVEKMKFRNAWPRSAWIKPDEKFHDRWIRIGGLISRAPRSSDLIPLDFFLSRLIKANIYKTKVQDIDKLKMRIKQEIEAIKTEKLRNIFMEISKRLNFCVSISGDTSEQCLWNLFVYMKTWQRYTSYEKKIID